MQGTMPSTMRSNGCVRVSYLLTNLAKPTLVAIFVACIGLAGCGTTPDAGSGGDRAESTSETTRDGLIKVETTMEGDLYIRPDHGIGGYDAIVIAPAFVNYRRASARLEPEDEELYLISLEQALVDQANSIGAPIEYEIGECTIKIGIGFVNVNLATSDTATVLGEMILVIEYQDSMSGESLLRLMVPKQIEREAEGVTRIEQIDASFERMIDEVNVTAALRSATAVPSKPREGCEGRLVNAGLPSVAQ
jgi:hypothetical protein